MMNILVTGCNGQLGNELKKVALYENDINWIFTDIETLNICNETEVVSFFNNNNIDVCINCAAYTAVDKAEDDVKHS